MKRRTFLASLIPASAVIASKLHAQQPVPAEMPKGIWYDKAKNALHINQSSVRLDGDQGQLTLDGEPLEKYLPDFKAHELAIILGPKAEVLMIGKKAMEVLTTEAIHPTITSVTGEAQLRIESELLDAVAPAA